jgi:hypothetical protein
MTIEEEKEDIARRATLRTSIDSRSLAESLVTAAISASIVMTLDLATHSQLIILVQPGAAAEGAQKASST